MFPSKFRSKASPRSQVLLPITSLILLLSSVDAAETPTPPPSAGCVFTSSTCSCRQFRANENQMCVEPGPDGNCVPSPCVDGWKCDCLEATHTCTRRPCEKWLVSESLAGNVACVRDNEARCLTPTGPIPTQKMATCVSSASCGPNESCLLGFCRMKGVCDDYLTAYCRAHDPSFKCCDASSACASAHFQRDIAMCSTSCGSNCASEREMVSCVFDKSPVGVAASVGNGAVTGGVWVVSACGGTTR